MTKRAPGLAALMLTAMFTLYAGEAATQPAGAYPNRPVKIVVSVTPGGANDILGRLFAQKLSEQLKQQFVVENRPGAGQIAGTEYVAKSPPDGYTLLLGNVATLGIHPSLFNKLPYDTQRDFVAISVIAMAPSVLVVNPSVPAHSVQDLVALARANPGKLNYASPGNGTSFHLSVERFKTRTGIDMVHVPYKGSAPALLDLLAGQVQLMFVNPPEVLPHINSGKVRPLASSGSQRVALVPNVPTMAEAGFQDAESVSWFALVAPRGMPNEHIAALNAEIVKAANRPEVRQRLIELGCEPVGNSPETAEVFIRDEIAKWAKVVKESGAKVDN